MFERCRAAVCLTYCTDTKPFQGFLIKWETSLAFCSPLRQIPPSVTWAQQPGKFEGNTVQSQSPPVERRASVLLCLTRRSLINVVLQSVSLTSLGEKNPTSYDKNCSSKFSFSVLLLFRSWIESFHYNTRHECTAVLCNAQCLSTYWQHLYVPVLEGRN